MVNKMISIFKPKKIKDFNPSGLNIYTFNAGFKKKDKDLLLIIFDQIVNVCCVYSKTSTPSAPIIWDKKNNKGKLFKIVSLYLIISLKVKGNNIIQTSNHR